MFFLNIKMDSSNVSSTYYNVKNIKGIMVNEMGDVTSKTKNIEISKSKTGHDYILINHRKLYIIELVYN